MPVVSVTTPFTQTYLNTICANRVKNISLEMGGIGMLLKRIELNEGNFVARCEEYFIFNYNNKDVAVYAAEYLNSTDLENVNVFDVMVDFDLGEAKKKKLRREQEVVNRVERVQDFGSQLQEFECFQCEGNSGTIRGTWTTSNEINGLYRFAVEPVTTGG